MIEKAHSRYCTIQKMLEKDGEYLMLKAACIRSERQLLELMENLTIPQREIITEYIGIYGELNERIVEIACFVP